MKEVVNNYLPHPFEEAEEDDSIICCREDSGWALKILTFTQAHQNLAEGLQEAPPPSVAQDGCPTCAHLHSWVTSPSPAVS